MKGIFCPEITSVGFPDLVKISETTAEAVPYPIVEATEGLSWSS